MVSLIEKSTKTDEQKKKEKKRNAKQGLRLSINRVTIKQFVHQTALTS